MPIRRDPELGRQAVLWLATAFVVLIGAGACAFIIVVSVEDPSQAFLFWGAVFGGLVVILISAALSREKTPGNGKLRLWFLARRTPKTVLRIGRKRSSEKQAFGTNAPPTLDSVREASEQIVTWVPHGSPPDRQRPR